MQKILKAASLLLFLNTQACVDDAKPEKKDSQEVDGSNKLTISNSAGNLIASAVKDYFDVDVALIPSAIVKDETRLLLTPGETISPEAQQQILGIYDARKDTIRTGTMKGSDIKDFILRRMTRYQDLDLQVAGIQFDVRLRGGWPEAFVAKLDKGLELEDSRKYRVAVSDFFYDYRKVFPGYYFGENMNFSLNVEADGAGSIKEALKSFLAKSPVVPPLELPRGHVSNEVVGDAGYLAISQIQGISHLSPYRGYRATTRGVITAVSLPAADQVKDWAAIPDRILPTEIIIQDPETDNDDRTSEAISVFIPGSVPSYKAGQLVEVTGVVHEIPTVGGFSGTALRLVSEIKILAENQLLPAPVTLGTGGRVLLNKLPSTFPGNQNAKLELHPNEGIDYWEALEGMRVIMKAPRVTGVRGGLGKDYIEISVVPDGMDDHTERTDRGGNFYNPYINDFNSESIKMVNSTFSDALSTKLVTDTGDFFAGDLIGIIGFQQNTFGNGRHVFYPIDSLPKLNKDARNEAKNKAWAEEKARLRAQNDTAFEEEYLTFATWNVENLSASSSRAEQQHMTEVVQTIQNELNCPDIVNLVEIQDNNGVDVNGGSAANRTLSAITQNLKCTRKSDYRYINIDPVPFRDGGEFGGNIRVAMIYNAARVSFTPKGSPTATSDTFIEADGSLSQNPGRIDPRNPAWEGARKSIVAEFEFRGKKVFVIGNHFNSMLGEGSPLGAKQPYSFQTEASRTAIAGVVRGFVEKLRYSNPDLRLLVAGDFNTYYQSNSLKTLAGDYLINMMTAQGMCPQDEWYTTNYDGNSGAIDFIFASPTLMQQDPKFRILHINSAFAKRVSDHDPVLTKFQF
jgi:hypothetical protein